LNKLEKTGQVLETCPVWDFAYRKINGRNKLYAVGVVVSTTTVGGEAKTAETLPAASFAQG